MKILSENDNKNLFKIILITELIIIALLEALIFFGPKIKNYLSIQQIEAENKSTLEEVTQQDISINRTTSQETTNSIPEKAYLEVPFVCQAPLETEVNWTLHEESCEEAALLQAYLYETNQTMTKQEANEEILKMIAWQKENLGSHKDIYADELKEFASRFYIIPETQIKIIYDASIEDIKRAVSRGYPVIVPIMGDILNNPYYPYTGYHMLTVIGYTKDRIITNDNGTRRGKDFSYDQEIFKQAMDEAGGDIVILEL